MAVENVGSAPACANLTKARVTRSGCKDFIFARVRNGQKRAKVIDVGKINKGKWNTVLLFEEEERESAWRVEDAAYTPQIWVHRGKESETR